MTENKKDFFLITGIIVALVAVGAGILYLVTGDMLV